MSTKIILYNILETEKSIKRMHVLQRQKSHLSIVSRSNLVSRVY
jgi:hypothetical protein